MSLVYIFTGAVTIAAAMGALESVLKILFYSTATNARVWPHLKPAPTAKRTDV